MLHQGRSDQNNLPNVSHTDSESRTRTVIRSWNLSSSFLLGRKSISVKPQQKPHVDERDPRGANDRQQLRLHAG